MLSHIPPPKYQIGHPLQALVTNLDASPYLGRLALCRVVNGVIRKGQQVAWCRVDGSVERATIGQLYVTEALDRHETDEASAGEIGETLADLDDPQSLPGITVDEPSLSMLIGINTSPFSGREGSQLTARMLKNRLDSELVGNVALRVIESDRPDAWIVQGRGELQLAILIENLRREGFELTVGRPQVVTKMVDDNLLEPVEFVTIDIPEEHLGTVTQLLALRKGRMVNTINHGSGRIRVEYVLPSRGLIGFHTQFLTETRGTGIAHHVFQGYEPWYGELNSHSNGSLVSDRSGDTTTFALLNLQERGTLFIGPGVAVYEGMIVGENSRASDMDVNPTKEKKLTNMRAASSDQTEKLTPPRQLSLELALELLRDDECLEITPNSLRVRKVILGQNQRRRQSN